MCVCAQALFFSVFSSRATKFKGVFARQSQRQRSSSKIRIAPFANKGREANVIRGYNRPAFEFCSVGIIYISSRGGPLFYVQTAMQSIYFRKYHTLRTQSYIYVLYLYLSIIDIASNTRGENQNSLLKTEAFSRLDKANRRIYIFAIARIDHSHPIFRQQHNVLPQQKKNCQPYTLY